MYHICGLPDPSPQERHTSHSPIHTCGVCGCKFLSICSLHQHLSSHDSDGSYFYDGVTKVAFLKHESACKLSQTDESQTSFMQQVEFLRKYGPVGGVESDVEKGHNRKSSGETDHEVSNLCRSRNDDEDVNVSANYDKQAVERTDVLVVAKGSRHEEDQETNESLIAREVKVDQISVNRKRFMECTDQPAASTSESSKNHKRKVTGQIKRLKEETFSVSDVDSDDVSESNISEVGNIDHVVTSGEDATDSVIKHSQVTMMGNGGQSPTSYSGSTSSINQATAVNSEFKPTERKRKKRIPTRIVKESDEDLITLSKIKQSRKVTRLTTERSKAVAVTGVTMKDKDCPVRKTNSDLKISAKDESCKNKISETDKLQDYFVATNYVIKRKTTERVFNQGEKDDLDKVSVQETWIPDAEWIAKEKQIDHDSTDIFGDYRYSSKVDLVGDESTKDKNNSETVSVNLERKATSVKPGTMSSAAASGNINCIAAAGDGAVRLFICEQCGKTFSSVRNLRSHCNYVHLNKEILWKCSFCDYTCSVQATLRRHIATHNTEYSHVCEQCGKSYKADHLLKIHVRNTHNRKKFRCINCKLSFDKEEDLAEHKKSHGEFRCKTCQRVCSSFGSLARHRKIHSDERNHQCHICSRRFLQKSAYWIHMEKHHDLTKAELITMFPLLHLDKHKHPEIATLNPK